jgi:predicted GNAT family N-acyltransferase
VSSRDRAAEAADFEIRPIAGDAERAEAYAIRREVFVDEQDVPVELELDDRDPDADHLLARRDGRAVGTGRLVVEPPGFEGADPAYGPVAHLGRIAVLAEARHAGLGAGLVRGLEGVAVARGLRIAYLGAQVHAVPFYERLGYAAHGAVFDDAGIDHRHMTRVLRHEQISEDPAP